MLLSLNSCHHQLLFPRCRPFSNSTRSCSGDSQSAYYAPPPPFRLFPSTAYTTSNSSGMLSTSADFPFFIAYLLLRLLEVFLEGMDGQRCWLLGKRLVPLGFLWLCVRTVLSNILPSFQTVLFLCQTFSLFVLNGDGHTLYLGACQVGLISGKTCTLY